MPREISAPDLARLLAKGKPIALIDVRESWEREIASLAGDRHIPLAEIPVRLGEIPRDRPVVIYCHLGIRSYAAAGLLENSGWAEVKSLEGGIEAWSCQVDSGVARY